MSGRVRRLHEVVLHLRDGQLDQDEIRHTTERVPVGDDVVIVVRGGQIGPEPAAADLLGRSLADAGDVTVFVAGRYGELFRQGVERAKAREAATW